MLIIKCETFFVHEMQGATQIPRALNNFKRLRNCTTKLLKQTIVYGSQPAVSSCLLLLGILVWLPFLSTIIVLHFIIWFHFQRSNTINDKFLSHFRHYCFQYFLQFILSCNSSDMCVFTYDTFQHQFDHKPAVNMGKIINAVNQIAGLSWEDNE